MKQVGKNLEAPPSVQRLHLVAPVLFCVFLSGLQGAV